MFLQEPLLRIISSVLERVKKHALNSALVLSVLVETHPHESAAARQIKFAELFKGSHINVGGCVMCCINSICQ